MRRLVIAGAALAIGAVAGAVYLLQGARGAGPGVTSLRIADADTWAKHGFVPMTPPVRLPTDRDRRDRIVVWLKVGDGTITARDARTLAFPAGTVADRVETVGDALVDVRGTRLVADGELFHVYVAEDEAPSPLVGWEWRRGDAGAEERATQALVAQLRQTKRKMRGEPAPSPEQQQQSLASYAKNNACANCHVHDKPLIPSGNVVHRPTDDDGFFVPLSVLSDSAPLERHRPWEANAGDPYLAITCESGDARLVDRGDTRHYACAGDEIPRATLDMKRALADGDAHARDVCAARRYLAAHMDEATRALYAAPLRECE